MQTLKSKLVRIGSAGAAMLGSAGAALAAPAIANDTLQGLPQVGSDTGNFLSNLAPGVGTFVLILGIFGGITAIVFAVAALVVRMVKRGK